MCREDEFAPSSRRDGYDARAHRGSIEVLHPLETSPYARPYMPCFILGFSRGYFTQLTLTLRRYWNGKQERLDYFTTCL